MQSKKHSHYEIITNQVAGLAIGWAIVFFIFPFLGMESTVENASVASVIFFAASYSRAYIIRRIFNQRGKPTIYEDEVPYKEEPKPARGEQPIVMIIDGKPEEIRNIYKDGVLVWTCEDGTKTGPSKD